MLDFEEESELQSPEYAEHKKRREQRKKEKMQLLEFNHKLTENTSELTNVRDSKKLYSSRREQRKKEKMLQLESSDLSGRLEEEFSELSETKTTLNCSLLERKAKNRRRKHIKKTDQKDTNEMIDENLMTDDKQLLKFNSSQVKTKTFQKNRVRSVSTSEVDNYREHAVLAEKNFESVTIDLDQLMLQWPGDKNCAISNKSKTKQKMNSLTVKYGTVNGTGHLDLKSKSEEVTMPFTQEKVQRGRNIFRNNNDFGEQSFINSSKNVLKKEKKSFFEYMKNEDVRNGLQNGELFIGNIRINPRDYKLSYISNPNKIEQDILITSMKDRNGALEGDNVVVKLKDPSEWKNANQKTGYVVYIFQKIHPRTAVGNLRLMIDKNKSQALFYPRDSRIPRIKMHNSDCPSEFFENPEQYENILYLVKITKWVEPRFAYGIILKPIGNSGQLRTESLAILEENGVNITPCPEEMKNYFPRTDEIDPIEFQHRLDLRKECIFTIDPATAKDLDDAVSCKLLQNGNLEIGVHISDVTYYLKKDTPLDKLIESKATSTYMVDTVYHMLPQELCTLCSLLPGEDKLTFSVFWEMTKEGKVISHKFSRTVINSCVQLSYEHAQNVIDNPNKQFEENEFPKIYNGFKPDNLSEIINNLHKIALNLRKSRYQSGALRIDTPKIGFSLNSETGLPESYHLYVNKECHRLIEEFMLLANITVATRLRDDYPDIAFMRKHPPPNEYMMLSLKATLEKVGIHIDISTTGGLQQTLWKYYGNDSLSQARMLVLNMLCAKPMSRALYFFANNSNDTEDYWHYSLNIPLYTHFTSPIRRFADIVVHRQLAGSLGYTEKPKWPEEYLATVAGNCNKRKYNSKKAGEQSIDLYFIEYVGQNQPMTEKAVVWDVKEGSFDAILESVGITVRIYLNNLEEGVKYTFLDDEDDEMEKCEGKKLKNLLIEWPEKENKSPITQIISIFSIITVTLTKKENKYKLDAKLCKPED